MENNIKVHVKGMVSGREMDRNKPWIDSVVKRCPIVTKVLKLKNFD